MICMVQVRLRRNVRLVIVITFIYSVPYSTMFRLPGSKSEFGGVFFFTPQ